jgi:transcriptional regulator with XRE-family HTH domain
MLSETLAAGIQAYEIGPTIRLLRSERGFSLAQLAGHTGLSAGMLSRLETGQVVPTLPTLMRIAMVFGVGLERFFADGARKPVLSITRRAERLRLPSMTKGGPAFHFESLDYPVTDRAMEGYLAYFDRDAPASEPHSHKGTEIVYVIEGAVELTIRDRTERLGEGDSIYFESDLDHSYRGVGDCPSVAIVVVCPDR